MVATAPLHCVVFATLGRSPSWYVVVQVGCVEKTVDVWLLAMFPSVKVTVGTAAPKASVWLEAVIVTGRWLTVTVPAVYVIVYLLELAPEQFVAGVVPAVEVTVYTVLQLGSEASPALAVSPYCRPV